MLHSDITPQWAISRLCMDSPSQFLKISIFRFTCWHTSRKFDSMYAKQEKPKCLTHPHVGSFRGAELSFDAVFPPSKVKTFSLVFAFCLRWRLASTDAVRKGVARVVGFPRPYTTRSAFPFAESRTHTPRFRSSHPCTHVRSYANRGKGMEFDGENPASSSPRLPPREEKGIAWALRRRALRGRGSREWLRAGNIRIPATSLEKNVKKIKNKGNLGLQRKVSRFFLHAV